MRLKGVSRSPLYALIYVLLVICGNANTTSAWAQSLVQEANGALASGRPRVALVVGIGDNTHWKKLPNAASDAALIARTLPRLGFTLIGRDGYWRDPTKAKLSEAIERFVDAIGQNTIALFYYAGHGIRCDNHVYLVPKDAPPSFGSVRDCDDTLMSVDGDPAGEPLLTQIQRIRPNLTLIVLDACQDEVPYVGRTAPRGSEGRVKGLQTLDVPSELSQGVIQLYSAQPGQIALDAGSAFATAFATWIVSPLPLSTVLNNITKEVFSESRQGQLPWVGMPASGLWSKYVLSAASSVPAGDLSYLPPSSPASSPNSGITSNQPPYRPADPSPNFPLPPTPSYRPTNSSAVFEYTDPQGCEVVAGVRMC